MNVPKHQESQSSYVEMSPDSETVDDSTGDCGDYFCMEKRTNSVPLSQNETRKVFKSNCFYHAFLAFIITSGHQIHIFL